MRVRRVQVALFLAIASATCAVCVHGTARTAAAAPAATPPVLAADAAAQAAEALQTPAGCAVGLARARASSEKELLDAIRERTWTAPSTTAPQPSPASGEKELPAEDDPPAEEAPAKDEEHLPAEGVPGMVYVSVSDLKWMGVVECGGWRYTYYEESVLPGGGLDIPGRHHDEGRVCDIDGYVCVASSDLPFGTVVDTPVGMGKVYDCGCDSGIIDIYLA